MTKPDEALLWAREDFAKRFRSRRKHVADSILSGFWDIEVEVSLPAHGYRAGAAASAERIKALEAAIHNTLEQLRDYADLTVDQWADSVADGGITAWMVIRQELQTVVAGDLARALLEETK